MTSRSKQIREELMKQRGKLCECCKSQKTEDLHHKDQNQDNNDPENLMLLCSDCHRAIHKRMRSTRLTTTGPPFYRKLKE